MSLFEYKIIYNDIFSRDNGNYQLLNKLNDFGNDGWEVVSVIPSKMREKAIGVGTNNFEVSLEKYILKRIKNEK